MPNFNGRETAAEVNLVSGLRARGKVKRRRRLCRNRGGGGGNDQGKQTTGRRSNPTKKSKECRLRELPLMTSAKFLDFLTPFPHVSIWN